MAQKFIKIAIILPKMPQMTQNLGKYCILIVTIDFQNFVNFHKKLADLQAKITHFFVEKAKKLSFLKKLKTYRNSGILVQIKSKLVKSFFLMISTIITRQNFKILIFSFFYVVINLTGYKIWKNQNFKILSGNYFRQLY